MRRTLDGNHRSYPYGHATSLTVFQQGTYAPDGVWRWMGSIARDKMGDILVGYSKSCGDTCPDGTATYPSVYLAGRQVNDPLGLGNLESEVTVVDGTGSQPCTANRWGDYSSMRIDTNDGMNGCTFWYTTEYYMVTAAVRLEHPHRFGEVLQLPLTRNSVAVKTLGILHRGCPNYLHASE